MNPVVALIITNIIWGAASPIFKLALTNIPPFTLAFIRFFFAGILFLPFVLFRHYTITKKQLFDICVGAFFAVTINISFYFLGIQKTTSISAPVIASSQPIFLFLFAIFFLHEKPHPRVFAGIFTSLVGVLIIIFAPLLSDGAMSLADKDNALIGNAFLTIATFGAIMQTILLKKVLKEVNPIIVTTVSFFFGALTFSPLMTIELTSWSLSSLNSNGWMGIIFGVFFSSAIAYGLFMYGISKIDAQEVGVFAYIDPVIAVVLAIPLLQEYPTPLFFIGSFFVFLGIFIAERRIHWHPFHKLRRVTRSV